MANYTFLFNTYNLNAKTAFDYKIMPNGGVLWVGVQEGKNVKNLCEKLLLELDSLPTEDQLKAIFNNFSDWYLKAYENKKNKVFEGDKANIIKDVGILYGTPNGECYALSIGQFKFCKILADNTLEPINDIKAFKIEPNECLVISGNNSTLPSTINKALKDNPNEDFKGIPAPFVLLKTQLKKRIVIPIKKYLIAVCVASLLGIGSWWAFTNPRVFLDFYTKNLTGFSIDSSTATLPDSSILDLQPVENDTAIVNEDPKNETENTTLNIVDSSNSKAEVEPLVEADNTKRLYYFELADQALSKANAEKSAGKNGEIVLKTLKVAEINFKKYIEKNPEDKEKLKIKFDQIKNIKGYYNDAPNLQ